MPDLIDSCFKNVELRNCDHRKCFWLVLALLGAKLHNVHPSPRLSFLLTLWVRRANITAFESKLLCGAPQGHDLGPHDDDREVDGLANKESCL